MIRSIPFMKNFHLLDHCFFHGPLFAPACACAAAVSRAWMRLSELAKDIELDRRPAPSRARLDCACVSSSSSSSKLECARVWKLHTGIQRNPTTFNERMVDEIKRQPDSWEQTRYLAQPFIELLVLETATASENPESWNGVSASDWAARLESESSTAWRATSAKKAKVAMATYRRSSLLFLFLMVLLAVASELNTNQSRGATPASGPPRLRLFVGPNGFSGCSRLLVPHGQGLSYIAKLVR